MKFQNKEGIPLSLAVWLASDEYDYNADPNTISATTLLNPIKAIVLGLQNKDLEKIGDIVSQVPSRMGTAIHDSIEGSWLNKKLKESFKSLGYPDSIADRIVINPDKTTIQSDSIPVYMEQRATKEINGYKVSGKFDFVAEGTLEDFKSTSVYTLIMRSNDLKWLQQGSIYRWLNPDIITEDHMWIRLIFTDWSAAQARQSKDYPKSKIASIKLNLMPVPETEQFVFNIISQIKTNLTKPQEELPDCTREELWQKDDAWKYYKNPEKTARATKNFTSAHEAHQRFSDDGSVGVVKHVPGQVVKCRYCNVAGLCTQAQMLVDAGLLVL